MGTPVFFTSDKGVSFSKDGADKTILLSPDNAYLKHFKEP